MSNALRSKDEDLSPESAREQLVDGLRRQLGRWTAAEAADADVFSSGAAAVDRLLPEGGLRHGMLIEWLAAAATPIGGAGAATLALLGAREACHEGGALVVIDRGKTFYPPAAAAWGIDLERTIVIHPQNARDELWAAVQALRSPAVAAMWAAVDRLDSRAFRRLQLAAQAGRTLGVLVRPAKARGEPSWADATLEVMPRTERQETRVKAPTLGSRRLALDFNRRVQVQLVRCHNGRADGSTILEIDDAAYMVREASSTYDTHSLSVVPELGDAAGHLRSARA